jgi:hypothetical protein
MGHARLVSDEIDALCRWVMTFLVFFEADGPS